MLALHTFEDVYLVYGLFHVCMKEERQNTEANDNETNGSFEKRKREGKSENANAVRPESGSRREFNWHFAKS